MSDQTLREATQDLLDDYAELIDDDRLEEWLELFTEDCTYEVVSRENLDQGLAFPYILCAGKNMLRDRVTALRKANKFNFHYDRHVVSGVRVRTGEDGAISASASYAVFQTTHEGRTKVFSVGRYAGLLRWEQGRLRFVVQRVVVDTSAIPRLLATPL